MSANPDDLEHTPGDGPLEDELEPEPGTETEPEPGPGDEPDERIEDVEDGPSSQAILAELEKEHKRHTRAIAKALDLEPEAMHECPVCEGVGFTPEPLEKPSPLVQDPFTEQCSRCKGNGTTLSGATPRGMYEIPCQGCSGAGYVQLPEHPEAGADFANGAPPPAYVQAVSPAAAGDLATITELRARGYTILEPIQVPAATP